MVHGLAFANAVLRKTAYHIKRCSHYISGDDSNWFYQDKQFICLNYVKSTAIAISGLTSEIVPPTPVRKVRGRKTQQESATVEEVLTRKGLTLPMCYPPPVDKVKDWPIMMSDRPTDQIKVHSTHNTEATTDNK